MKIDETRVGTDNSGILYLQNKKGTLGCILKNTFCPPYKKPRLPFGGKSAKVHGLLRSLKIAHAFLVKEHLQLEESIPAGHLLGYVLYDIDALFDDSTSALEIGRAYWRDPRLSRPFLAAGFEILKPRDPQGYVNLKYAYDLCPFGLCRHADAEIVADINIEPLKTAAGFYNDCVAAFYEADFLIMPTRYVDEWSILPPEILPYTVPLLEI